MRGRSLWRDDPRFRSERLALQVCRLELATLAGELTAPPDVTALLTEAHTLCAACPPDDPESVQRWVVRQAPTSGLRAALFAAELGPVSDAVVQSARSLIESLANQHLAPPFDAAAVTDFVYRDEESDFVYFVACARFAAAQIRRSAARIALHDLPEPRALTEFELSQRHRLLKLTEP